MYVKNMLDLLLLLYHHLNINVLIIMNYVIFHYVTYMLILLYFILNMFIIIFLLMQVLILNYLLDIQIIDILYKIIHIIIIQINKSNYLNLIYFND